MRQRVIGHEASRAPTRRGGALLPAALRCLAAAAALLCAATGAARAQSIKELQSLSIADLSQINVTSVSKSKEPLSDAPAAIYVISHADIMRSGATTLPEMLRLAPNLEVAQLNAQTYAISARGLNVGDNASLSNKLLVLIDGRSVYTPLFAGVYWDMQTVPAEDIERIEVISGPGATLWGANAVNGVINIITRNSADTQGGYLEAGAGNLQRGGMLQYGGRVNSALTYRVYGLGYKFSPFKTSTGADAEDAWSKPQGGFRVDWSPVNDHVSVQGDLFEASEEPSGAVGGHDVVASWDHKLEGGSALQAQAYYDVAKRFVDNGGGGFRVDTYDAHVQHHFSLAGGNDIVWGVGDRIISYEIENTSTLLFQPAGRTLNLADLFGQDTIALSKSLKLTLGLKIENEPFTGIEPLPSIRLGWKVTDNALLWGAVSRAVRAATPVDRDIIERLGTTDVIHKSFNFMPETLTAYELGTRIQATSRASFSVSTFYNVYDDLRSIETTPGGPLPYRWGNQMEGLVYGLEAWGDYRVADWWHLSAGFNIQHEHFHAKPGSTDVGGTSFVANDPNHQASLRSYVDLGHGVSWYAGLRYVGALPNPHVAEYAELDTRLAWRPVPRLELSVAGYNLIHARHTEFIEAGISDQVPRSFFVDARWHF